MPKSRIMYVEYKGDGIVAPARIGRVTFSKSGKTINYGGKAFRSLKGVGFKSNYYDVETGEEYWIRGAGRTERTLCIRRRWKWMPTLRRNTGATSGKCRRRYRNQALIRPES